MKAFFVKHKKQLINLLILLIAMAAFSVLATLILKAFGIIYFDDGINFNKELFDSFKGAWYGWLLIILIQIAITSILSFVPGVSMAFIMLLGALYEGQPWQAFFIAFLGVELSSIMMYIIGRIGGYKICAKLLGEGDCERASNLLNDRGVVFFPIMMVFPIFPDDALVMIAGTLKMSLRWFLPSIFIGRGIGIATIIFGLGSIPYDKFTTPWHWIAFIAACAVGIVAVFYAAFRFNKFLEKRKHSDDNK